MAATSLLTSVLPRNNAVQIQSKSQQHIIGLLDEMRMQLAERPTDDALRGAFRELNMAVRMHLRWA